MSMPPFFRLTCATLIGLALAAPAVQAQLFGGDNEAREAILQLRQEIATSREQSQSNLLQLHSQIEQMQQQIARLRGQQETLAKQVSDLQQANANAAAAAAAAAAPPRNEDHDPSVLLNASPQEQQAYDAALALFRDGRYAEAAPALDAFLKQYPSGGFSPAAQFYLGSSLYATGDHKGAITQLQKMVTTWPDSPRAPDALLVISSSQVELRAFNNARATLQRITRDYPNSEAARTASDRLKLLP